MLNIMVCLLLWSEEWKKMLTKSKLFNKIVLFNLESAAALYLSMNGLKWIMLERD